MTVRQFNRDAPRIQKIAFPMSPGAVPVEPSAMPHLDRAEMEKAMQTICPYTALSPLREIGSMAHFSPKPRRRRIEPDRRA